MGGKFTNFCSVILTGRDESLNWLKVSYMENFDWTEFTLKISIRATQQVLYDAWATSENIEKWFLRRCEYYGSDAVILDRQTKASRGDGYSWQWYAYDVTEKGRILNANGKDHFSFTFAGECVVEIKFEEELDFTLVTLRQNNIPTDDKSKINIRFGCNTGWRFFLLNLKSVYEGGIDLRNTDHEKRGMLNN